MKTKLPKSVINAFFLFARYRNAYEHYKSVRKHFETMVAEGLANPDRTLTSKGKEFYRELVSEVLQEINAQVEEQTK